MYCQVNISTSDWSLAQGSPAECGVCECDREASNEKALAHYGLSRHGKNDILNTFSDGRDKPKSWQLSEAKGYGAYFLNTYGYISPSLREINSQAQLEPGRSSQSNARVTKESGFGSQQGR